MSLAHHVKIEEAPQPLPTAPLEWFVAEHYHHRRFCRWAMEAAQADEFDATRLEELLAFLKHDLPAHVDAEEQALFPLLRSRALPDDEIEKVLRVLSADHEADAARAEVVRIHLETCLARRMRPSLNESAKAALLDFAARELRHLALENAVVLPLARLRLSREDLRGLGHSLAARRGVAAERQSV